MANALTSLQWDEEFFECNRKWLRLRSRGRFCTLLHYGLGLSTFVNATFSIARGGKHWYIPVFGAGVLLSCPPIAFARKYEERCYKLEDLCMTAHKHKDSGCGTKELEEFRTQMSKV